MYLFKYVMVMIVILSYFIGNHLPLTWGWENSPLEWSQVATLLTGAVLCGKWRKEAKSAGRFQHARFFTWSIPLWLLMAGREMSWGRVFYPVGINAVTGPYFIPVSKLPYGPIVYPAIAIVIVTWLFAFTKHKLYTIPYELYQQDLFPIGEFLLIILSFVVSNIAEKQLHYEIMEEIVELVTYLSLLFTAYRVKVALQHLTNRTN